MESCKLDNFSKTFTRFRKIVQIKYKIQYFAKKIETFCVFDDFQHTFVDKEMIEAKKQEKA